MSTNILYINCIVLYKMSINELKNQMSIKELRINLSTNKLKQ